MAEFPALPLWTDAYLADTRHLSTLEHGAYLLLLMEAWRRPNCDLPDDDRVLARLAGLSTDEWGAAKPIVMEMWTHDGRTKTWKQKRLSSERVYVKNKSRSQRDKAKKRWKDAKKDDAAALPEGCPDDAPTPTPTPTPTPNISLEDESSNGSDDVPPPPKKGKKDPEPKPEAGLPWHGIPEWIPLDAWHRFLSSRRDMKRYVTAEAAELIIADLANLKDDGHPPGDVLDQTTKNGWMGVFPLDAPAKRNQRHGNSKSPRNNDEPQDPFVRASIKLKAERAAAERS